MASEFRKIIFSNEEFRDALRPTAKTKDRIMPEVAVLSVDQRLQGKEKRFFLTFDVTDDTMARVVSFGEADVLGALLVFCQRAQVPVPRNGKKLIRVGEEGIELLIRTDS